MVPYADRPPQQHFFGARRSDAARDPGAARARRDVVTELAEPFRMSMPAVSKHLKVLERAGLITRGREAQWRPCRIEAQALKPVDEWLENYRKLWEERFDRLEVYLRELQAKDEREAGGEEDQGEETCTQEIVLSPQAVRSLGARVRRAGRSGVALLDRAGASREMVGAARLHDSAKARATFAPAASGAAACAIRRAATPARRHLSRNRAAQAHRDDPCVGRRERQARRRDRS